MREIKFTQAVLEATDQLLAHDPNVLLMGLGVTDPKGIFGTTLGLEAKHGGHRVMDMPTAENAMTGILIGAALMGMRPILTHQRIDFAILSLDQIINSAAKWYYMFGGQLHTPIVIRMMIGRGWGQGPQHSQSLQALFGHIPGLKVVMPATPYDAKGLLIAASEDGNPVIYLEHRWLHTTFGPVPEEMYRVSLGQARIAREGKDVTIIATSFMVIEALRAAQILACDGIEAEVVDMRSIKPLDKDTLLAATCKTGRLIVADGAWRTFGVSGEIIALAAEEAYASLKCPPRRVTFPDVPTPTTPALAIEFYPRAVHIINAARATLGLPEQTEAQLGIVHDKPLDVPDSAFMGPF